MGGMKQKFDAPIAVWCDGEDVSVVQLASDRVAGSHALTHCQLARELGRHLSVVTHLLVLAPYRLPERLQPPPFLPKENPKLFKFKPDRCRGGTHSTPPLVAVSIKIDRSCTT